MMKNKEFQFNMDFDNSYCHEEPKHVFFTPTEVEVITEQQCRKWKKEGRVYAWKAIIFHIVYFVLNIVLLSIGAIIASKYISEFKILWYVACGLYGLCYTVIANVFCDLIIKPIE